MKENLNVVSDEKLEEAREINTLSEKKVDGDPNGGGKPGTVKDALGHWTDAQIAENPIAYINYLEGHLKSEYHADKVKDIISEIEEVREKYLTDEYAKGKNR